MNKVKEQPNAGWNLLSRQADIRISWANWTSGNPVALALATLCRVEGSAPRPLGTQMLFSAAADGTMSMAGYFSGGCIEADVAGHARNVLKDGQPRLLVYGSGSPWIDIRLVCGGSLHILVERIEPDSPEAASMLAAYRWRLPVLWNSDGLRRSTSEWGGPMSRFSFSREERRYALPYLPRRRLLIITRDDAAALALAELADLAEFETVLWRPDGPTATCPIGAVNYVRTGLRSPWPIAPDAWTAVAVMTHDTEVDSHILPWALRSEAGYVGVLGAARRAAPLFEVLKAQHISDQELAKLRMPVGLANCGKAPWEVAIGILAQLLEYTNSPQPWSMDTRA